MAKALLGRLRHFFGFPEHGHHAGEQLLATLGGVLGIAFVVAVTRSLLGPLAAVLVVPSMGASAVLIFAAPHSVFAQPWAVLGGHLVSALIGVACRLLVPDPLLAAALAVGLAIGGMHLTRSLHPPGGATALAAVIGGQSVADLGFAYALMPVGINALIILAVGVAFNYPFAWRRYPAALMKYAPFKPAPGGPEISEADIMEAMDRLNGVVDTGPDEIREIFRQSLAIARQRDDASLPRVELGRYYCNDLPGQQWSVRRIVDERRSDNPEHDMVIYRVVDGQGLHRVGSCTRREFARWVGSELKPTGRRVSAERTEQDAEVQ